MPVSAATAVSRSASAVVAARRARATATRSSATSGSPISPASRRLSRGTKQGRHRVELLPRPTILGGCPQCAVVGGEGFGEDRLPCGGHQRFVAGDGTSGRVDLGRSTTVISSGVPSVTSASKMVSLGLKRGPALNSSHGACRSRTSAPTSWPRLSSTRREATITSGLRLEQAPRPQPGQGGSGASCARALAARSAKARTNPPSTHR